MISEFKYTSISDVSNEECQKYKLITKLKDTQSKHIVCFENHQDIEMLSHKVGYEYLRLGSHRKYSRIASEIERINNMSISGSKRPARFVITTDGRIWADNTHWTIAYLLNNPSAKIIDIPSYIE